MFQTPKKGFEQNDKCLCVEDLQDMDGLKEKVLKVVDKIKMFLFYPTLFFFNILR